MSSSNFLPTSSNSRKNRAAFYIYGKHSAIAAIKNPERKIIKVYCVKECLSLLAEFRVKTIVVDNNFLNKLLGNNAVHQGIVLETIPKLNALDQLDFAQTKSCKIAILDQISDPQNFGTIIRSAVAFNIDAIIFAKDQSCGENSTVAKVAVGALEKIKLIQVTNLSRTIDTLKKHGFWIIGLDGNANHALSSKIFTSKSAVILGSEGKGIRSLVSKNCDFLANIPISTDVESLNVANAAAIAFYEMNKSQNLLNK